MNWLLRAFLIVICVAFLVFVLLMVRRDRFLLKYSIIWVVLGVLGLLAAFFPGAVVWLSLSLGFETPVNFVFLVCIMFLLMASLVFVAALSKQSLRVKELVQEISMLKAEVRGNDAQGTDGE